MDAKVGVSHPPDGRGPRRLRIALGVWWRLRPAFIGVGSLDLFLDEDRPYARRLAEAGVPVTRAVVPGAYHGFDVLAPKAEASLRFRQQWLGLLRGALHAP